MDTPHQSNSETLKVLEAYWHELRGPKTLPERRAIDPTRIDAALPYSFILERVAPGVGRLRVSGQKINDLMMMEARGMPLSMLFEPTERDRLQTYVEACFADPAIVELSLTTQSGLSRPKFTGRLLLMPLAGVNGIPTRALGAIVTEGIQGRSARRFSINGPAPIRHEKINMAPMQAFDQALYAGERKRPTKRPALRLVVDNDRD